MAGGEETGCGDRDQHPQPPKVWDPRPRAVVRVGRDPQPWVMGPGLLNGAPRSLTSWVGAQRGWLRWAGVLSGGGLGLSRSPAVWCWV